MNTLHEQHKEFSPLPLVISLIVLIAGGVFFYLYGGTVFGAMTRGVTLTTNPDLENGLIAHYTFDKSLENEVADRSGNGYTGYFDTGGDATSTKLTPGPVGQAVRFDGTDDRISLGDPAGLRLSTNPFTIAFWVWAENKDHDGAIINKRQPSGSFNELVIGLGTFTTAGAGGFNVVASKHIDFAIRADSSNEWVYTTDEEFLDGAWHHVVLRRPSSGSATVFVDGVQRSLTVAQDLGNSAQSNISVSGQDWLVGSSNSSNYADAALDDVRIYDRALSAEEIERLYSLGATTHIAKTITTNSDLENGLVGHWTFDGNLDTQITDSSGSNNDGYFLSVASSTMVVPGVLGQAVNLNPASGSTERIRVSTTNFTASQGTVAVWAKFNIDGQGNEDTIFSARKSNDRLHFLKFTNDQITLYLSNHGYLSLGITPDFDRWYHYAVTWDNSTWKVYVDGTIATSGNHAALGSIDDGCAFFGKYDSSTCPTGGGNFNGMLDDARVYNRQLSADEVKRLYSLGATTHVGTPKADSTNLDNSLVAHYTFDDPAKDFQVRDSSGNNNHGYFSSAAQATSSMFIKGVSSSVVDLDGADDHITIYDDPSLDITGNFSIAAWVYRDSAELTEYKGIVCKQDGDQASAANYCLYIANTDDYACSFGNGSSGQLVIDDGTVLEGWHHFACVVDGTNAYLYLDGAEIYETPQTITPTPNAINIHIGTFNTTVAQNRYFDGKVDDVRIYSKALTVDEVKRLYQLGI